MNVYAVLKKQAMILDLNVPSDIFTMKMGTKHKMVVSEKNAFMLPSAYVKKIMSGKESFC